jgi:predicted HicB family RNase H-like nuclease
MKRAKHAGGRPPLPAKDKRQSLTVRLPQDLLTKLHASAKKVEISVSALVESLLIKALD